MKRIIGIILALMMLAASAAYADSAVDVIMNIRNVPALSDQHRIQGPAEKTG